jgi:YVTN family beta-propeller protein
VDFLALDAPHRRLYGLRSSGLTVIDTRANRIVATIRVPLSVEDGPPVIDSARQRLYATGWTQRGYVAVIDTRTNTVKAKIRAGYAPDGPVLDTARRRLYVPEFDEGSGTSLFVIDTAANKLVQTVTVGEGPRRPVLDAAANRLYVPNWASGGLSVVDTAAAS